MDNKKYFTSDNLPFIASAILTGRVTIEKVVFHTNKPGVKVYFLTPADETKQIYLEYVSDKLSFSPQLLSDKITAIKHLQAETSDGSRYGR